MGKTSRRTKRKLRSKTVTSTINKPNAPLNIVVGQKILVCRGAHIFPNASGIVREIIVDAQKLMPTRYRVVMNKQRNMPVAVFDRSEITPIVSFEPNFLEQERLRIREDNARICLTPCGGLITTGY